MTMLIGRKAYAVHFRLKVGWRWIMVVENIVTASPTPVIAVCQYLKDVYGESNVRIRRVERME